MASGSPAPSFGARAAPTASTSICGTATLTPPEAPFDEPWQAHAFALAVELHRRGAFTWTEWADALAGQIAARVDAPYYECWLAALEALATGKGLAARSELADRKTAWEHAFLTTPHGKPVQFDARAGWDSRNGSER